MRIGFGSDHAAVDMKAILMEHLAEQGHECVDFGPESAEQRTDYPDKALEVAEAVKYLCGKPTGLTDQILFFDLLVPEIHLFDTGDLSS